MLYYSMHRTQLHLDDAQYRWLKRRADEQGSIAAVVRGLIDEARQATAVPDPAADELLAYLCDAPAPGSGRESTVATLDDDLYGA